VFTLYYGSWSLDTASIFFEIVINYAKDNRVQWRGIIVMRGVDRSEVRGISAVLSIEYECEPFDVSLRARVP